MGTAAIAAYIISGIAPASVTAAARSLVAAAAAVHSSLLAAGSAGVGHGLNGGNTILDTAAARISWWLNIGKLFGR